MRHLKRFQTWLAYVYCAAWALRQQRPEQYRIYQGAAEKLPANPPASDSPAGEFDAAMPCATASSAAASPVKSDPVQSREALPAAESEPAADPKKKVTEAASAGSECVAPKGPVKPAPTVKKVANDPLPPAPLKSPALAASSVKPQPKPPESPKAQRAKGSALAPAAPSGKYDPAAINDQTAQRLARLLVSEIKLYYTSVTNGAGLGANNIYDILKDPIDKSRQHYQQRMGATIETMPDYFHGELVRSLCAGDESRLGPNYPSSN